MSTPSPERAAIVHAAGLVKVYHGRRVVDEVDLAVFAGECFGLLGPNGAGKTTTLRMLLGLTVPDAGSLEIMGHAVPAEAATVRRRIGVVPQLDNLDPDFSVSENLSTHASYYGIGHRTVDERLPGLLRFAALEQRAGARIETLSGGMKRRLTLARALVNDPRLLILDEPTTGLDPQARQLIWQRLRGLLNEGRTLILTTHYMEEAERLCDRLAIMDHGRVLALGAPSVLIREHIEPHVLEVHGPGLERWLAGHTAAAAERIERVGETAFCYVADETPLLDELRGQPDLQFLHRRATLEDVFLKLTGRDLRE